MDTIQLVEREFKLVPAGEDVVLTITNAKAMPKAKPSKIEVVFTHANGGAIKQTYDLVKKTKKTDKNPMGLVLFSILARTALGNSSLEDFSLSKDLPKLIDKSIVCEVKHSDPKDNEEGYVYANIKRIIRLADDFEVDTPKEIEEVEDEEDDL